MKTDGLVEQSRTSTLVQRRVDVHVDPLIRLRAVVLLAGTVRPSELRRSVQRSLLDLPVRSGQTVLDLWHTQTEALARVGGRERLPLRIMIDQKSQTPKAPRQSSCIITSVERDPAPFRGTGGVLRDICRSYDSDDVVLVANAAQILTEPVTSLAKELSAAGGDVALMAHRDGTPAGMMLVRCGVLEAVRPLGFMDFKEQVLPQLAARGDHIRIVRRAHATGIAVRTLDGYIGALRTWHQLCAGRATLDDPLQEDWRPTFELVEDGASVAPSATVHDSVVLSGGVVEEGAVVVRSVVCPGGIVKRNSTVADMIVAPPRIRRTKGAGGARA